MLRCETGYITHQLQTHNDDIKSIDASERKMQFSDSHTRAKKSKKSKNLTTFSTTTKQVKKFEDALTELPACQSLSSTVNQGPNPT